MKSESPTIIQTRSSSFFFRIRDSKIEKVKSDVIMHSRQQMKALTEELKKYRLTLTSTELREFDGKSMNLP